MAASSAMMERDAWRLFEVDLNVEQGGLGVYLDRILARCVDWFHASNASVFLRDGHSNDFRFAAGEASLRGTSIRAGRGIAGVVAETGQAVLVNDPSNHPLLKGRVSAERRGEMSSSIVVPLTEAGDKCIGVLNLSRFAGLPEFDDRDLVRMRSIARQLSLAVLNARLFAQLAGAMAEIERSNEKLNAVLRSLGVAVLVLDDKKQVTDWNDEAGRLMELELDRWPITLSNLEPHEIAAALEEALSRPVAAGPQHRRAESKEGRSWSITLTRLAGGGATATVVDTTEHDRQHTEMARLKRLAEVGQMTAAIAHEIRNPLTGIRSAAQVIEADPAQGAEFAGIIDSEVMKLNQLCEQFLEFARPLTLRIQPMNLAEVCAPVAERHRDDFARRNVTLDVQIDSDTPTILADALRLEQVARNLLLNGLQACKAGGTVRMHIGDRWLSVEDDGCGMTAEEQERLFTPFFTTKPSGTGLGLSNLRKIIDAHGGKISATSEKDSGSRFLVTLPSEVLA